jgi:hypothetical protein
MGATLSKLWASIRGALTGAPAGKSSPQHQNTNTTTKDIESGTYSPARTTEVAMSEVKKYEITEVRLKMRLPPGGMVGDPAEVIHPNEDDSFELQASAHQLEIEAYPTTHICCAYFASNGIEECDLSSGRLVC